jgi:hypothetical protein
LKQDNDGVWKKKRHILAVILQSSEVSGNVASTLRSLQIKAASKPTTKDDSYKENNCFDDTKTAIIIDEDSKC